MRKYVGITLFSLASLAALFLSMDATAGQASATGQASRVEGALQQLEDDYSGGRAPRQYVFEEADLNAYLQTVRDEYESTGVREVRVRLLQDNALSGSISVDSDRITLKLDKWTQVLVDALLDGEYLLEFEGNLKSAEGRGTFELTSARVNGIPVPVTLVDVALQTIGSRLNPPFDPKQGFEMGLGIDRVTIEPRKAVVHTLPQSRRKASASAPST